MERKIPLYTLEGVQNAAITTHPFSTPDKLGLSLLRFLKSPCDDVVMIIHGLTTSSDMFIMPEHKNLVTYLHEQGYTDVWCLDYRMSNRYSYNLMRHRYTMDDIALFDYPPALDVIRKAVGPGRRIHVISHCLGAVSFTMGLFGGVIKGAQCRGQQRRVDATRAGLVEVQAPCRAVLDREDHQRAIRVSQLGR